MERTRLEGEVPAVEVPEKPVRRRFSAEYKLRILAEADGCTEQGQVGELLRREGERRELEIAIVSDDPDRRRLARAAGLPTFSSPSEALGAKSWRGKSPEPVDPPPPPWWEDPVDVETDPLPADAPLIPNARRSVRLAAFAVAVLVLAIAAYAAVPSGVVSLVPDGSQSETIV